MATAEELVASMDGAGVDMAVVFGFAWKDPALCQLSNDYVLEAVRSHAGRLVGYAVVNPRSSQLALREVERCMALGCQGVGELMPDGQGYALDEQDIMAPLLGWLDERKLPLLVHTNEPVGHDYRGKGDTTPAIVYRLALSFPQVTLICAHWGGGLLFYELMPEVRQTLANVYYDTAASLYLYDRTIFPLAETLCRDKILFATDYPLIGQQRFLHHVRASGLSSGALEQILGANAERLLSRA